MQNQYKMNRILTLGVLFSLLLVYRTACASQSLPTYDLGKQLLRRPRPSLKESAYVDGSHHPGKK